jgi:hypothetical protein
MAHYYKVEKSDAGGAARRGAPARQQHLSRAQSIFAIESKRRPRGRISADGKSPVICGHCGGWSSMYPVAKRAASTRLAMN